MTGVQRKAVGLIAAFVLVVGCAIAIAMPQHAYAADTKLVAGTTFEKATTLSLADKALKSSNRSEFNSKNDSNFYKFTTSGRDSRYRLKLRSYDGLRIYVTVYDATRHRIAYMSTKKVNGQSWTFKNLARKSTYYVELWRFVTDGTDYIDSGSVLDKGYAEAAYPKYRITVSELVTKPTLTNFKATSPSKGKIRVKYKYSYNTDKVQVQFWWAWQSKRTASNTFNKYTTAENYKFDVKYPGKKYEVRVRPYCFVNGKRLNGKWSSWEKVKVKKS